MLMSIPQCIILEFPDTHSTVNDSRLDFDLVFLEIQMTNCIVGMLLTCPITSTYKSFVQVMS